MAPSDLDDCLIDDEAMESEDELRFKVGRTGDSMICPFQCDRCQFLNITKRLPIQGNHSDDLLLLCI